MKNIFVLLSMCCLLSISQVMAQIPTSGLVGYFPFNGSPNNVSPVTGTGTINGSVTLTTDRHGNPNAAYLFQYTGVEGYISVPHNAAYNVSSYTISLWFKNTGSSINSHGALLSKNGTNSGHRDPYQVYVLKRASWGRSTVAARSGNPISSSEVYAPEGLDNADNGNWHHAVFCYDNANDLFTTYYDGVLMGSVPATLDPNGWDSYPINIGRWEGNGGFNFIGAIDDIRIYNVPYCSQSVVSALFNECNSSGGTVWYADTDGDGFGATAPTQCSVSQPSGYAANDDDCNDANAAIKPGATEICNGIDDNCDGTIDNVGISGLMLYLPFNGNANDLSGRNHPGAVFNATLTTDRNATANSAYSFNGSNAHIDVADHADLRPANLTLSVWVFYSSSPPLSIIAAKPLCPGTQESYVLYFNGGSLFAAGCNGGSCVSISTPAPSVGQWHMVTYTFDDVNNSAKLYVDGSLVSSTSTSLSLAYDASPLQLGTELENCSNAFYFPGKIDDASLFNRVLSPAEISTVYTTGPMIPTVPYYADIDGDGYGNPSVTINACAQPSGYVANDDDCNDGNANQHPGATEMCSNSIDDDCDGATDEAGCTSVAPIPTLSEWGLIILFLLTIAMSTVFMLNRQVAFATPKGAQMPSLPEMASVSKLSRIPFDGQLYKRVMLVLLPLAVVGFFVVHYFIGTNGALDFTGTMVSAGVVGYIVHLVIGKK